MMSGRTSPRLRPSLAAVPGYTPARVPAGPAFHRLAANESPYPPLPGVVEQLLATAGDANRYPDMWCRDLTAALSAQLGVPAAHIAVGTGSVGITQQLLQITAGPQDEVLFAWRSFEAYPVMTRLVDAAPVQVPLTADDRHDLEAMARAVTDRTRLVIVCNPNNPTGTVVGRAELERFLDRMPEELLIVIDEAYVEFADDPDHPDGIELYRDRPNVCVLRTFSKAYGLAGMRVGYAVAHEPVTTALRTIALPFGVSQLAQDAAIIALRAESAMRARVVALTAERARVIGRLTASGWAVGASRANFIWLRLGDRTSAFADACTAAGVSVMAFPGEGVRVSIGDAAANDEFLCCASRFRAELAAGEGRCTV
ncbi:histidinol-phosphate transaminase [Dactylosporangium fulvum]|uniref:Aromatic amino acid aminotransferase n=1 Tax=Dactylosporangium fulvum TaxID=53359 RepID=A0ABY5W5Q3_9ACTN|nr:histidinol-phosphate transaminase [Dactylosporangium fulvum]UWP85387.1 histidinol-phosphate transaminase [Dactylosporangium fulvum]